MRKEAQKIEVHKWDELPVEKLSEWVSRRGIHGQNLTIAQFIMKKSYIIDVHSHPNEQATLVLKGAMRLDFATGDSVVLRQGDFVIVPANMSHGGEVLEDTLDLDAFAPLRSDWLAPSDKSYYTTGNREGEQPHYRPQSVLARALQTDAAMPAVELYNWEKLPTETLSDYVQRRAVNGQNLTFAQFLMKKGTKFPAHSHANEQATFMIKGSMRLDIDGGESVEVNEGEFVIVPPNVVHSGEVFEDSVDIDAFAPVRSDWLSAMPPTYYADGNREA